MHSVTSSCGVWEQQWKQGQELAEYIRGRACGKFYCTQPSLVIAPTVLQTFAGCRCTHRGQDAILPLCFAT